ncbi:hypothetical protein PPL_10020 [Heterostelium album PN500]|uniref:Uncharacterized protein n=1 Tax=Heterostelium pallidum (strain ATCC 26659 / Pp 5 / PN500) TaxID=670386 RepID=D3BPX6_HETP5|nr:hypothetical protein PPL_10020 [Heterostelium album PN500]EFA76259.1 hypothetical protein PPL_10020 [Heterostelium album PN500]|eukprot:XP_020428392.1 hypothetical protein PPL_10020 [Heterostelium album PN500]
MIFSLILLLSLLLTTMNCSLEVPPVGSSGVYASYTNVLYEAHLTVNELQANGTLNRILKLIGLDEQYMGPMVSSTIDKANNILYVTGYAPDNAKDTSVFLHTIDLTTNTQTAKILLSPKNEPEAFMMSQIQYDSTYGLIGLFTCWTSDGDLYSYLGIINITSGSVNFYNKTFETTLYSFGYNEKNATLYFVTSSGQENTVIQFDLSLGAIVSTKSISKPWLITIANNALFVPGVDMLVVNDYNHFNVYLAIDIVSGDVKPLQSIFPMDSGVNAVTHTTTGQPNIVLSIIQRSSDQLVTIDFSKLDSNPIISSINMNTDIYINSLVSY